MAVSLLLVHQMDGDFNMHGKMKNKLDHLNPFPDKPVIVLLMPLPLRANKYQFIVAVDLTATLFTARDAANWSGPGLRIVYQRIFCNCGNLKYPETDMLESKIWWEV